MSTSVANTDGQSSAGDVAVAVSEAVEQARTLATAAAGNAGVRLGRLIAIEIKPVIGPGGATFLTGADLFGRHVVRNSGQAIEVITTYEAFP